MGISSTQALDCFRSDDLVGIGMEADSVRRRLHPEGVVSYVVERRIDLSQAPGAPLEAACNAIREALDLGGTGVCLENIGFALEPLESLLRSIREQFPTIWLEGLSAPEVTTIASACGLGLQQVIARLRDAGLDSIAGNGPAMQDDAVRDWIEVHRTAHGLGMPTVAALVFGAGETLEQRVAFLEAIRLLQEETGGFTAFIPQTAEAPGGRELDGMTAVERLKTLAISRMFLDNIPNVQATRSGQGLKVLQMGLRFGANDLGAVTAGAGPGSSEEDLRRVIRDAGFTPVERDVPYRTMFLH